MSDKPITSAVQELREDITNCDLEYVTSLQMERALDLIEGLAAVIGL